MWGGGVWGGGVWDGGVGGRGVGGGGYMETLNQTFKDAASAGHLEGVY